MTQDPMLPAATFVSVRAPFRPTPPGLPRLLRDALRRLRLRTWTARPGIVSIALEEMDLRLFALYCARLTEGLALLYAGSVPGTVPDVVREGGARAAALAEVMPAVYAIPTGIDDPEFWRGLLPSDLRAVEEAIDRANPALQDAKKNFETMRDELRARREGRRAGPIRSTPSAPGTDARREGSSP